MEATAITDEQHDDDLDAVEDSRAMPDFADPRAAKILQLALEGRTWEEVAAESRLSIRTVFNIRRAEHLDELVTYLSNEGGRATIRAYMHMRRKAFLVAAKLMDDTEPEVALGAVREALRYVAARDSSGEPAGGTERTELPRDELVRRAGEAQKRLRANGGGRR